MSDIWPFIQAILTTVMTTTVIGGFRAHVVMKEKLVRLETLVDLMAKKVLNGEYPHG